MDTGEHYHRAITATQRDRRTRDRFLGLVLGLLPPKQNILDFGAGTGIDAKAYAAAGHTVWAYEPDTEQSSYLEKHCQDEIGRQAVIPTEYPPQGKVKAITANFAVFNLAPDHESLFRSFAYLIDDDGFALISLLNPYYLSDARYGWWWGNLLKLMRQGWYAVQCGSGVRRYAPRLVVRSAAPYFQLDTIQPKGPVLWTQQYLFLLFRRI